jgi:hypothetical protein
MFAQRSCAIVSVGLCLFSACMFVHAAAPTTQAIETSRAKGLAWLLKNQKGDGSWRLTPGLEIQTTAAAVTALKNAGTRTGRNWFSGVAFLAATKPFSVDSMAQKAETLYVAGFDVSNLQQELLKQRNFRGSWGTYKNYDTNIADTALAGKADARITGVGNNIVNALCTVVLSQKTGGGWSYQSAPFATSGLTSASAILPTSYAVRFIEKSKMFGTELSCTPVGGNATMYNFATITANGLTFLKSKQNLDGGFSEAGVSGVLDTALAVIAISGTNATDAAIGNAQSYLIAQQASDGSWGSDPYLTALALQTYPAVTLTSTAKDGIPDVVKQIWGVAITVPSQGTLPGNGLSVTEQTSPGTLQQATQWQAYAASLAGGGSSKTYGVKSGRLPLGLSLSATGSISGIPNTAGIFVFSVEKKDGSGTVTYITEQIEVIAAEGSADTPTLPEWGAIFLGALLLGFSFLNQQRGRS